MKTLLGDDINDFHARAEAQYYLNQMAKFKDQFDTSIPPTQYSEQTQVRELMHEYAKEIILHDTNNPEELEMYSEFAFLIKDQDKLVGFILGSSSQNQQSPFYRKDESFCPTAMYLLPEYRAKQGTHSNVKITALKNLVKELEETWFDKINIFQDGPGGGSVVHQIGEKHVLEPLYKILRELSNKSKKGKLINFGMNDLHIDFNPQFVFDINKYAEKVGPELFNHLINHNHLLPKEFKHKYN